MSVVKFDPSRCSGCWACTIACADENDIAVSTERCAYRQADATETEGPGGWVYSYSMRGCMHCEEPACMDVCPAGCYSVLNNGIVLLDNSSCIGCGLCIEACPWDAVRLENGRAEKCNGCHERLENGLRPACERICPTGALCFKA